MNREQLLKLIATEELGAQARQLAIKRGVRPVDLPMTAGEQVTRTDNGYRWERPPVIDLPTAREALNALIQTVRAEERHDAQLSTVQLSIDPDDGWLAWDIVTREGEHSYGSRPYLVRTFAQLCSFFKTRPRYMSQYLLSVNTERRSVEFGNTRDENAPRDVVVRFRRAEGDETHHAFACVSPGFRDFDPDKYSEHLLQLLGADADRYRCNVVYAGNTARVALVALDETRQALDDSHTGAHAAAEIWSADDGTQSIRISGQVYLDDGARFATTDGSVARIIHTGKEENFRAATTMALRRAEDSVKPWLELWGTRQGQQLPTDPETCIAQLAGAGEDVRGEPWLKIREETPQSATYKLTQAWARGCFNPTHAGLAHCLASAASSETWASEHAARQLQQLASALLWMTPTTLKRLVLPPKRTEVDHGVQHANLDVSEAITDRRNRAARLRAAADSDDPEAVQLAGERAALYDIEADQIEETGVV